MFSIAMLIFVNPPLLSSPHSFYGDSPLRFRQKEDVKIVCVLWRMPPFVLSFRFRSTTFLLQLCPSQHAFFFLFLFFFGRGGERGRNDKEDGTEQKKWRERTSTSKIRDEFLFLDLLWKFLRGCASYFEFHKLGPLTLWIDGDTKGRMNGFCTGFTWPRPHQKWDGKMGGWTNGQLQEKLWWFLNEKSQKRE